MGVVVGRRLWRDLLRKGDGRRRDRSQHSVVVRRSVEVGELLVAGASGDGDELYVPEPAPTWADPRPVPPAHTEEFEVAGALAWVSNDAERVDALVDECGFAAAPFVGLDVEWTPSFVRGQAERPALLQLATRQRCVLVRINQMAARGAWPPRLRALLGADAPLKVGRGVL